MRTYRFRDDVAGIPAGLTAQAVGETLEEIGGRAGGVIQPVDVVEASRPADAPLHRYFEWRDEHAAELYRLDQARRIIRSIAVVYQEPKTQETRHVVAYVSVRPTGEERGYRPTLPTLADPATREIVIRQALNDLRSWQQRYSEIVAAAGSAPLIEEALARIEALRGDASA